MAEQIVPLYTFSFAELHKAHNLADFLDSQSIETRVMGGQNVPGEEAILVAVPNSQILRARKLADAFMSDYNASVGSLQAKEPKPPFFGRVIVWFYMYVIPLAILAAALDSIYKATLWRDDLGQRYFGSDFALADGLGLLLAAVFYIGAVIYVHRLKSA